MTALVFDFGTRYVGLALASPTTGIITELETVQILGRQETRADFEPFVSVWKPDLLLVGLPLNMDGTESEQTARCRRFGKRLEAWFHKPVAYADERLSTVEAVSAGRHGSESHAAAAWLIGHTWLQSYQASTPRSKQTVFDVRARVKEVDAKVQAACIDSGREPSDVTIVAVSKTRSAEEIRRVANAGINHFGENYLQEALPKQAHLANLDLHWHFVGPVQSNKAKMIARVFDWVHTVDSPRIADRLDRARRDFRPGQPLQVCLQVNIDNEESKAGATPEDLVALAEHVMQKRHLCMRGLMALPRPRAHGGDVRSAFARTRKLFRELSSCSRRDWDTLSIGTSDDFLFAIQEGATMLRIGTAIFGPRS